MDISLKQRLVGASVLVALGVIFIPMILQRNAEDDRLTVRMEIPDKPNVDFKSRLDDRSIEKIEWPESMEETTAEVREENAWPPPETVRKEAVALPVEEKQMSPPAENITAGANKQEAATPPQWIVQLGSFSKEANALALQDKLEAKGFKPFVKSADTPAGLVYRVRIGPMQNRDAAEAIVGKLGKQGHRAIVMNYPEKTVLP